MGKYMYYNYTLFVFVPLYMYTQSHICIQDYWSFQWKMLKSTFALRMHPEI